MFYFFFIIIIYIKLFIEEIGFVNIPFSFARYL